MHAFNQGKRCLYWRWCQKPLSMLSVFCSQGILSLECLRRQWNIHIFSFWLFTMGSWRWAIVNAIKTGFNIIILSHLWNKRVLYNGELKARYCKCYKDGIQLFCHACEIKEWFTMVNWRQAIVNAVKTGFNYFVALVN